jgi:hypothetical protein
MDVQDFDGFSFRNVDDDVGERRKRKFSCAGAVPGLPRLGEVFRERIRW